MGNRIKFPSNEYRQFQVSNETLVTFIEITQFLIELDDKRTASLRASEYSDHIGLNLCHAYALTVFSSQGTTIDGNTFTLYSGRMGQRETYVALSRHKDESHIYVNEAEIDERIKVLEDGIEPNAPLRQAELEKMMVQDRHATLAIEHLKAVQQCEKTPEQNLVEEVTI